MPDPVRDAIFAVLVDDTELGDLAPGGIWHREAAQGTRPPLVIFTKVSGVRSYAFAGPPLKDQVWTVKGVGDADSAEDIDQRCQELLAGANLAVDGHDLRLAPMAEDDVNYGEETDGEHYEHIGTHYRLVVEAGS